MNDTPTPDKPDFRCIVDLDLFRRAMGAVSKDALRYYLHGVHIEPCKGGGALLVATDGHLLVAFRDANAIVEGGSAIVRPNKNVLKDALREAKQTMHSTPVLIVANEKLVTTDRQKNGNLRPDDELFSLAASPDGSAGAYQWCDAIIDGTYPDWRRIVGTPDPKRPVCAFNISIIRRCVEALYGEKHGYFSLQASAPKTSIKPDARNVDVHCVIPSSHVPGIGFVMPVSFGDFESRNPSWLEA